MKSRPGLSALLVACLIAELALVWVVGASAAQRIRPPDGLKCPRNNLTSFTGTVLFYHRRLGRNSFRGPRFFSVDLSLVKQTRLPKFVSLGEEAKLDFRANLFNAFNKLNLRQFGFAESGTVVEDNRFGRSGGALAGRVIEFQARLSF